MADATADLLIEIGTEELPPTALQRLSAAFAEGMGEQLRAQGIGFAAIERFATPRRLALLVRETQRRQPDRVTVRRGPAVTAAFDDAGAPTPAAVGFARSCGVAVSALERETSDKGTWLCFRAVQPGQESATLVAGMTEAALAGLPIPKRMRWGSGVAEFVRPVHWVCGLFGEEPLQGAVLGMPIGQTTRGHRFHHPQAMRLSCAADYPRVLREEGRVEPDFARRRSLIVEQIAGLVGPLGLKARTPDALLDEVTALVEWPQALLCHFDRDFLEIPSEALIETMQSHQRYFPVEDGEGRLQAAFVVVANIVSQEPAQVRAGNERVIRPRFADAAFFWNQDRKRALADYGSRLESMVFQERLGSLAAKAERVAALGSAIAGSLGADPALVERAARLAKCDLVTAMVYEMPSLQGIMGRYYAAASGEDPCVVAAMEEQYWPRVAGDLLPRSPCGMALAIADRVDTLVGIFGIGQRPSGTKDPYALRRAAIAVLRILIETPLDLDLRELLGRAVAAYPSTALATDTEASVLAYILERLQSYYADRGVAGDTVEAVLATGGTRPADLDRRILAVSAFRVLPESAALAAANKRIRNLLSKVEPGEVEGVVDGSGLRDAAEVALAREVEAQAGMVGPLIAAGDYVAALKSLASLRETVDVFFTAVMVLDEDPAVRRNRLRLLGSLSGLFLQVADISRLNLA